jgi:hypothetical protein
MIRRSFVAFDYYIGNLDTANPTYTSAGYLEALGSADYLQVAVCIDRVTGTAGFDLFVEHSCDGNNFATANSLPVVFGGGDITFPVNGLSTTAANYGFCRAGYKFPLMAFVRLRISLGNPATHAHLYATAQLRDREKDHSQSQGDQHPGEHLRPTRGVGKQMFRGSVNTLKEQTNAELGLENIGKSKSQ